MSEFIRILRRNFSQMSLLAKLFLLGLIVLFFMILGTILAIWTAIPLFHTGADTLYRMIGNPDAEDIAVVKYFQMVQSIFLFLLPSLLAAWLFSENTRDYLKTGKGSSPLTIFLVLISLFTSVPLMNVVTMYNARMDLPDWMNGVEVKIKSMEESAGKLTELFLQGRSYRDLAVNFIMIAVLPALGEEFFFRGVLQRLFIDWTKNNHLGIIIAASLFSFIHFQFYGFIPRLLLGLYFGYLLVWSASIWVPVAAHLINNSLAVFYYFYASKPMGETALDTIGTAGTGNYALYLSAFLTSVIIGLIYIHERQKRTELS